ncbi:MAG: aminotransferase, partial [Selenomonas sp.]|nr:aminotransferase [Selenomonas sp.]
MTMAASHAANKKLRDAIFGAAAACSKAAEKYGKDKVVNATIGMMMKDDGSLAVLPTVEKVYH